jgi:hypothetical protein
MVFNENQSQMHFNILCKNIQYCDSFLNVIVGHVSILSELEYGRKNAAPAVAGMSGIILSPCKAGKRGILKNRGR